MKTYNCARVNIGDYSTGYISSMPQDDSYRPQKCGYKVLDGDIITKRFRSVRIRGAQDSEGDDKYHILESFVIYPKTDRAIIRVYSRRGRYNIQLVKCEQGENSTMYKMRL